MEEKVIIVDEMLVLYQLEDAFNILLLATWELYFVTNDLFAIQNCENCDYLRFIQFLSMF